MDTAISEAIYLDNNATTRVAPEVLEAMLPVLTGVYGNPSSPHRYGMEARRRVEEARAAVAALLGASPGEVVFTSGGTEANHLALQGALALRPGRRRIVTTAVEHPSTLLLLEHLAERGYEVVRCPVDREGVLDLAALQEAVTEETAVVSVMWANNETGVLQPVAEAAAVARARGALVHTDAVQAVGKVQVSVKEVPVDFLAFSGHKLHGPKGIGALFVRKGLALPPMLWGHQERKRRGGTENVPGAVGLGKACELAARSVDTVGEGMQRLRDRLESGILRAIPFAAINGGGAPRVPNTSNVRFGTLDGEAVLDRLERAGIAASPGSACSSGSTAPSHVLLAMGLSRAEALASVRFSLSRYTTEAEIERVVEVLPAVAAELASLGVGS